MKALYIAPLPEDIEHKKDQNVSNHTVMGARIYHWEALTSIIRYSGFDKIFLPKNATLRYTPYEDMPLYQENRDRIGFLEDHELVQLAAYDEAVISYLVPTLADAARRRRLTGRCSIPVTGIIHSIHHSSQPMNVFEILAASPRSYDAMICSSRAGRDAYQKFIKLVQARVHETGATGFDCRFQLPLIPLGVHVNSFAGPASNNIRTLLGLDDAIVVLYFGRLSEMSKADLVPLIFAFSQVLEAGQKAWLVLAGDDTQIHCADHLRNAAERFRCGDRVRVMPNPTTAEKQQLYRMADVFVAPSDNLQETFGITVVEAMAAGLPVIAADWDGYRDTVVHGKTGYLIPTVLPIFPSAFDRMRGSGGMVDADLLSATTTVSLPALREAIQTMVVDGTKRKDFGRSGQKRALSLYDWPAVVKAYEDLWTGLCETAKAACQSSSGSFLDLEQYDYRDIFRHYASTVLTEETRLAVTEAGRSYLAKPMDIVHILGSTTAMFKPSDMQAILEDLEIRRTASVSELMSCHSGLDDSGRTWTMAAVGRLLKYGLVELV